MNEKLKIDLEAMNTKDVKVDLDAMERAALAAKPGKWTWKQVGTFNTPGCAVLWPDTSKGGVHYRRIDSGGGMEQADADFIAAANPAVVLELIRRLREAESHVELYAAEMSGAKEAGFYSAQDLYSSYVGAEERVNTLESELAACREDGEWVGRVMQSNLGPDRNWSGLSDDEKDLWDACQRLRDAARAKEGGAE